MKTTQLQVYSHVPDDGSTFFSTLLLPLVRSVERRAPLVRGPVSDDAGATGACATVPEDTTVLCTGASTITFFGLFFGTG